MESAFSKPHVASLLNDLGVGSYEWRPAEDHLEWSAEMLAIYGLPKAPKAEKGFINLVHRDDQVRVVAYTSAVLGQGSRYDQEFRIVRPDGEVRVIHDRGVIERDSVGRALVLRGVNVDVTRHRLDRFADARKLADTRAALYDYDIGTQSAWWSDEVFRLFAVRPTERISPHDITRERVHPDDREEFLAQLRRASRQVGAFTIDYRVTPTDDTVRWIRDSGTTIGPIDPVTGLAQRVRGHLTDITAFKIAEAQLQATYASLQAVIDKSPFGLYIVDANFRISMINAPATASFAGVPDPVGLDLAQVLRALWPEPFASDTIARFRHTLATGEPHAAQRTTGRRLSTGAIEAYEWRLDRIPLADGSFGVVCHFHDATEQAAKESHLRHMADRLELAHDTGGIAAWDYDLRSGDAVWTDKMFELLGLPRKDKTTADDFFARVHEDDVAELRARFDHAIATGTTLDHEFRIVQPDGTQRHLMARGRVVEHDETGPTRAIGINYDTTEHRRLQRDLIDSQKRMRLVLDNSLAFVGLLDPDGTLREANAPALLAGGLEREDVVGRRFWDAPWWTHSETAVARLKDAVAAAASGHAERYDAVVRMKDDAAITIDFMLSPILNDDGQVTHLVASGYDVSARDAALEHVKVLMHEVNHRAKNLLAVVQVIARQSRHDDADQFLSRFESRLQALSRAQDLLLENEQDQVDLARLAQDQLAVFAPGSSDRVSLSGPQVALEGETGKALGMAFHELATNATKYGALSNDTGTVKIGWALSATAAQGTELSLSWTEQNGPAVRPPEAKGFGSFVIGRMLESQLHASVNTEFARDGVRWRAALTQGFTVAS